MPAAGGSEVGSLLDRAIIKTALTAQPQLRVNLNTLVCNLTGQAFSEGDLVAIEREIVEALKISEAVAMPSTVPPGGAPLVLTPPQLGIARAVVSRFRDQDLRQRLEAEIGKAISAGRIQTS